MALARDRRPGDTPKFGILGVAATCPIHLRFSTDSRWGWAGSIGGSRIAGSAGRPSGPPEALHAVRKTEFRRTKRLVAALVTLVLPCSTDQTVRRSPFSIPPDPRLFLRAEFQRLFVPQQRMVRAPPAPAAPQSLELPSFSYTYVSTGFQTELYRASRIVNFMI
jgi:hypothetical protein